MSNAVNTNYERLVQIPLSDHEEKPNGLYTCTWRGVTVSVDLTQVPKFSDTALRRLQERPITSHLPALFNPSLEKNDISLIDSTLERLKLAKNHEYNKTQAIALTASLINIVAMIALLPKFNTADETLRFIMLTTMYLIINYGCWELAKSKCKEIGVEHLPKEQQPLLPRDFCLSYPLATIGLGMPTLAYTHWQKISYLQKVLLQLTSSFVTKYEDSKKLFDSHLPEAYDFFMQFGPSLEETITKIIDRYTAVSPQTNGSSLMSLALDQERDQKLLKELQNLLRFYRQFSGQPEEAKTS